MFANSDVQLPTEISRYPGSFQSVFACPFSFAKITSLSIIIGSLPPFLLPSYFSSSPSPSTLTLPIASLCTITFEQPKLGE